MPISLAASSQTQIGSAPFSNFRQRLSQSIIGTKQLTVEETDSGAPFFIHTRNRAMLAFIGAGGWFAHLSPLDRCSR